MRSAPRLSKFLEDNKDIILQSNKDLFIYSEEELNEILLLLYLIAPLNNLFFQLQKDDSNSVFFGLYYFKLIKKYLDDMELITSGGRLKGDLGSSLKTFDRYKSIENFNNKEYDLIHIFTDANKLFIKEYYEQQFFTVYLVMDALNPFSKFSFTQKVQKSDEYAKFFNRLYYFFDNYLESTISSRESERCLVNFSNSGYTEKSKSLHKAIQATNSEERNEFIRYMLECKVRDVPDSIEGMGKGIYEFWISRRKEYPELSKLALSLLYLKCSSADIERSSSICKSIISNRCSLDSKMLEASILIRLGLDTFGIRSKKDIDTDLEETVFNYICDNV